MKYADLNALLKSDPGVNSLQSLQDYAKNLSRGG